MKPSEIRNVSFIGHGDGGKTSLVEAMLHKAGATNRLGDVGEGSAVCDFEPDEKERKNSLDCGIVYCNWKGLLFNLIDTPGYPDFIGEAISGLSASDMSFLAINASSGVMVNTRKMWEQAVKKEMPRAIVINKMDMENIKFDELMASIQESFGDRCMPVFLPLTDSGIGGGSAMKRIISITDERPKDIKDVATYYEKLLEAVVEIDDALLNKYLDGKEVTESEFQAAFKESILKAKVIPVLVTSYRRNLGIQEFLDFVAKYVPSPADMPSKTALDQAGKDVKVEANEAGPLVGFVFKVISDPFVGKITYIRLYSGTITADSSIYNARTKKSERYGKIFKVFGKEQRSVDKAIAGDIIIIPKLEDSQICDTLCQQNNLVKMPDIKFPTPMVSLSVEPKSKGDEQRLSTSLAKMVASDPAFKVVRDHQTSEMVITGMSNLHLDIIMGRLKRKFDVQINTKQPKIPYKETIAQPSEGHHKHKKQSGGRGQYGEVYLKLEPLTRGAGFEFANELFGGSVPSQYVPAVEKGIKEVLERGVIAGYHVVDVKVTIFDGSYHDVDSSEASFKIAGSKAFKTGFMAAKPSLLEPIVNIEITVPSKYMGDITGDLNSRRGRITGMDTVSGQQVIKATVPLGEIASYSTELRSITAGEGHYSIEFSHYDLVPFKIQEAIIAKNKPKEEKEDE
ncbi:MAG: elongation factor G [Candidatus Brocadiia bacterium]